MKILLDTCILSELRKPDTQTLLKEALENFSSDDLFVSVITLGEITKGIALLPQSSKKTALTQWAIKIEKHYANRILGVTIDIVHIWGELTANAQKQGKTIPIADGLIAATALAHGLHVVTRNVVDFTYTGALIINPYEYTISE